MDPNPQLPTGALAPDNLHPNGVLQDENADPLAYKPRPYSFLPPRVLTPAKLFELYDEAKSKLRAMEINFTASGQNGSAPLSRFCHGRYDVYWVRIPLFASFFFYL